MNKKSRTPVVDEMFKLVNRYLACNGGPTPEKCHEALNNLNDCLDKISRPAQVSNFEKQWRKIKTNLKQNSTPAKFRLQEIEIERNIANKKRRQTFA